MSDLTDRLRVPTWQLDTSELLLQRKQAAELIEELDSWHTPVKWAPTVPNSWVGCSHCHSEDDPWPCDHHLIIHPECTKTECGHKP
jgi:hypothetical protein